MSLIPGKLSKRLQVFIKESNNNTVEDQDKALKNLCDEIESAVYAAIKEITIVIPTTAIKVAGTPSAQTNIIPIVLDEKVGLIIK